ncbi:MAG: zinc-dependent alcohol dehydrogenase family protein [Candidatus Binataceae bacterium]
MRAMTIEKPGPIESRPLKAADVAPPQPGAGEILVRISRCGVCRTDLHVAEGDLPPHRQPIIPGHEIVGHVERCGSGCARFQVGARVGIAWLRFTCGVCAYCRRGHENLCVNARFTGYDHDGGYAEMAVVREDYAYALPGQLGDEEAAPLLCAGIIGFRSIKRADIKPGSTVGLYGFGGSAHIVIQVLKYWGCRVFVMSRADRHRELAGELGADWIGGSMDQPPAPLDAAILFAPAGEIVPPALSALDRGGVLAIAGIHLSAIPPLDYSRHLFNEREVRSVTANTRADGEEFLKIAGAIPIRTRTTSVPLEEANAALIQLKHDELQGAAVLAIA